MNEAIKCSGPGNDRGLRGDGDVCKLRRRGVRGWWLRTRKAAAARTRPYRSRVLAALRVLAPPGLTGERLVGP
jgi:hypothetical protein